MPPKSAAFAASSSLPTPNESEAKFFLALLQHPTAKIEIDWAIFAAELGYKDASVAKKRLAQILAKLKKQQPVSGDGNDGSHGDIAGAQGGKEKKKAASKKRGRAETDIAEDRKPVKKTTKKHQAKVKDEDEDSEGEDSSS